MYEKNTRVMSLFMYYACSQELAIPPGTAQFVKGDWKAHYNFRVLGWVREHDYAATVTAQLTALRLQTLNLNGRAGLLLPYGPHRVASISDRFFLGGLDTFKGFHADSVGPKSESKWMHRHSYGLRRKIAHNSSPDDAIGGELLFSGGTGLSTPTHTILNQEGEELARVRGQLFYNVGNLTSLRFAPGLQ
jgi:outer membrane protein assembly factor BamA